MARTANPVPKLRSLITSGTNGCRYKLKPFDIVEQDYTSLGNWQEYKKMSDGYVFKFTGGQSCWNGPQRSATVLVSCVSAVQHLSYAVLYNNVLVAVTAGLIAPFAYQCDFCRLSHSIPGACTGH